MISFADGADDVIALINVAFYSVHAAFAVVLRAHGHPLSNELLAQFDVVDHVAIMCADHITIGIEMGLRIGIGWRAKRSPAQLQNGALPGHFFKIESVGNFLHFADILTQINFACLGDSCRANGIVTAV